MNAKKRALGRGLDALLDNSSSFDRKLGSQEFNPNPTLGGISEIPLSQIRANPDQPRKNFDEESILHLSESIKSLGIIQPITVRKISRDRYELISGERRLRASQIIKLETIPAYVREADNTQVLEMALVENIQRQDLNSLEIALSYQHLIQDCNIPIETLGERVGKNRTTITNFLRLLKLPELIQIGLREDKLNMSHARAIINIESKQDQILIYEEILKNGLSVRQVEELVRKLQDKSQGNIIKPKISLPYKYQQFEGKLKKQFGKEISIKRNLKGKGTVNLSFKDDTELDELIQKLLN